MHSQFGILHGPRSRLQALVEHLAHRLPAQGPISVFIHHNTLHAFEEKLFEDAVVEAGRLFGCEPFLAEETYREELRRGHFLQQDLDAVLADELETSSEDRVALHLARGDLRRRILVHGIPPARGAELNWLLHESAALTRFRGDLPADARGALLPGASQESGDEGEEGQVRELWRASLDAVGRSRHSPRQDSLDYLRHRDALLAAFNVDTDELVHPVLIPFTSAYLDQGLAQWEMPQRHRGMYACFVALYGQPVSRLCGAWAEKLTEAIADDASKGRDALESLANSLSDLGVSEPEWENFLTQEALALRGWAGMVRQFEARPDRVPAFAPPARLVDYLAVRLMLERAVLSHLIQEKGLDVPLASLRLALKERLPVAPAANAADRAWPVFHAAQLCGLDATAIDALSDDDVTVLEDELAAFGSLARRRLLHLAYERHLRHRFFDAVTHHQPESPPASPTFQAIFCLDERAESFRRHLEEVEPQAETFGTAGFFGVAMYFRSATDAHARPLCPVGVQPRRYVTEIDEAGAGVRARWGRARQRLSGLVDKNIHVGSRTFSRGAVLMAALGVFWVAPLVLKVLFPWSRRGLSRLNEALAPNERGRLQLDRVPEQPPLGEYTGFTVDEMADIVSGQLEPLGIIGRMAPLIFVFGHGSTSLNNPQESAHDCGACGGGRGGPNARAFAQMANDPRVRTVLLDRGCLIPSATWFIGGEWNTANSDVLLFDLDLVPEHLRPGLERAIHCFEIARRREAHERCRRFDAAPVWLAQQMALLHVQTRATDLAQPRPEYGHATNAACIVGRRSRTRGLFLDRRAFLVSYDSDRDPEGVRLRGLLAAVVPVVAGISLEYFFGYIDPTGYGCGTKLPHNVTALIGVMDGAQSDLRTGLPWQMLEIHEPVRLTLIVETKSVLLLRILEENADLRRLVYNRWIFLAALDPDGNELVEIDASGTRSYSMEHPLKTVPGPSLVHYRGRRGRLPFARVQPSPARAAQTA